METDHASTALWQSLTVYQTLFLELFMKPKILSLAVLATFGLSAPLILTACNSDDDAIAAVIDRPIVSVEFVETAAAPTTVDDMSKNLITAKAVVTYDDGSKKDFPLTHNTLFSVADKVGGNPYAAGQLYDYQMNPLMDPYNQPLIAETPDANSLLVVDGNLWLVSHLEYDAWLSNGVQSYKEPGWYSRAPTGMILTGLNQADDGALTVKSQRPIDFSSVNGTWINCFGSQTPWNTHLGSEEDYDLQYNPLSSSYSTTAAGVKAMTELYFKNNKIANPYDYGWIPEVTVKADGSTSVVKHYAMGRGTWEQAYVMADSKTALMGDDGGHVGMIMFVADKAKELSAGTLYAAKWNQTSGAGAGAADLTWYKLGHATNAEIRALIDAGTNFDSIWNAVAPTTAADGSKTCAAGYTRLRAGSSSDECLMLKPGMEKAAAFLETRRYATYLGATTEWNKMEGIAFNAKDNRAYMLDMAGGQVTANGGEAINSAHVPTKMYMEAGLMGEDIAKDALGNTANVNKIANTDNVFFSEKMRTLFIGEDSGTHVNNYVWAYNVDTKKLTRIMSAVAGAENTGLQVLDNVQGKGAYIMGNTQHWAEVPSSVPAELKAQLQAKIGYVVDGKPGVNQGGFAYIGGLPAFK
jgi:hypothetical protein